MKSLRMRATYIGAHMSDVLESSAPIDAFARKGAAINLVPLRDVPLTLPVEYGEASRGLGTYLGGKLLICSPWSCRHADSWI